MSEGNVEGVGVRGLKARCACIVCLAIGLTPIGVANASAAEDPPLKSLERQIVRVEHQISVKARHVTALSERLRHEEEHLDRRLTHLDRQCSRLYRHDERANEACDAAAGLGIVVNLQSDIGKYEQASRDANDGIGGLEELKQTLNRLALELEERRRGARGRTPQIAAPKLVHVAVNDGSGLALS
jgi:chromosome segregation ATPase